MTSRRDFLIASAAAAAWLSLPSALHARGRAAAKPLDILVMGGTGFLGPHFVEAARARGHKLTLFNRGKSNPTRFDGEEFRDIEQLRGDRKSDLSALEGERRWDAVLDTSAYLPADVTRSAGLLAPRVGQYVVISTISVYAGNDTPHADESAAVGTLADPAVTEITGETYGPLKALCEQAAEAVLPGRATVVRPGLIVGPGDPTDRFTYWPARGARGGEILSPGTPDDPTQFIDVRDLADFILHLIEQRTFGVFNADSAPGAITMGSLIAACQQAGHDFSSSSSTTWVPADFLQQQNVRAWQDMPVWVPSVDDYAGFGMRSTARAQAAGLAYRPLETTVRDTLDWWMKQPDERRANPKAGLSPEREAGVLLAWHASGHH